MKKMILTLTLMMTALLTACGSDNKSTDAGLFQTMETVDLEGNRADASVFSENAVTLVNLWNVGCTPCINELPVLDQLNKEYEGKGAAIKGLYYSISPTFTEEQLAEIKEVLENAGAEYQQLTLSEDMINNERIQNVQAFPTTFVVDSEGNIVRQILGSKDYEGWKQVIEEELEKAGENAEK